MKIQINSNTRTSEVKKEFANAYPGLKLEFVKSEHGAGGGSSPDDIIKGDRKLSELSSTSLEGELKFNKRSKVVDVERSFHDDFGLNVQVFRRSGRVWIETVNTDQWTLEMQIDASHS